MVLLISRVDLGGPYALNDRVSACLSRGGDPPPSGLCRGHGLVFALGGKSRLLGQPAWSFTSSVQPELRRPLGCRPAGSSLSQVPWPSKLSDPIHLLKSRMAVSYGKG